MGTLRSLQLAPLRNTALLSIVIELGARWYVFIFLNIYGLGKIAGGRFYRHGRLPARVANTLLRDASVFDLAWTFMGYSFVYIVFVGLAEVIGAWLLLWQRTKLLGVFVLLPVMINIIVFDIVFLDKYGALASAAIYTLLLLVIVAYNNEAVARAVRAVRALTVKVGSPPVQSSQRLKLAIMAAVFMGVLFAVDQLFVNFFGHGTG